MMAGRRHHLRGVRGQAVPGVGAGVPPRRPGHQRGAGDVGDRGRGVLRRRASARTPAAHAVLARLADVGLGYLSLGQPLTTLSGGERQRLKLATQMAEKGGVYVLDEPTTGLHLADVEQLLGLLDRLVDAGKSVIVIEHHQAVMAHADWIIDLGPGAGHDGGRIVFEGTPADLVAARSTLTGEHLAAYVGTLPARPLPTRQAARHGRAAQTHGRGGADGPARAAQTHMAGAAQTGRHDGVASVADAGDYRVTRATAALKDTSGADGRGWGRSSACQWATDTMPGGTSSSPPSRSANCSVSRAWNRPSWLLAASSAVTSGDRCSQVAWEATSSCRPAARRPAWRTIAGGSSSSRTKCRTATSISADRLGQVERVAQVRVGARIVLRLAQVGLEVGGAALRRAGQQRAGVHHHDRVVVDVDDPGRRARCAWATSWVLSAVGMPVPMSRNCRMPASAARKPDRPAAGTRRFSTAGDPDRRERLRDRVADSRSAAKLSLPPSQ